MINTRRILAVTTLSLLVLGASACTPKGEHPESGAAASSPTPSPSASASADPGQSGTPGQGGQPTPTDGATDVDVADNESRCDMVNLQPAVERTQDAGGATYVDLVFTNEGPDCWIEGFPQVVLSSGGSVVSTAVRDGEAPGNVYTVASGGRVGVTLSAEDVDGVEGCTPVGVDMIDVMPESGGASTSLQLSLRVCRDVPSVAVTSFEPRP